MAAADTFYCVQFSKSTEDINFVVECSDVSFVATIISAYKILLKENSSRNTIQPDITVGWVWKAAI